MWKHIGQPWGIPEFTSGEGIRISRVLLQQDSCDICREITGQGAADQRINPELGDVVPPVGSEAADSPDLDAD